MYGAPDLKYVLDVLDGSHATDRIQAEVIEGLQQTFNSTVKPEGSNFVARNANGTILYSGTSAQTALQTAFDQGGHIYVGPGTYNTTTVLSVPSNTHIEADMNAVIRGAPAPNSHPLIRNSTAPTSPSIGNSYIILEGGTWDGNSADDSIPTTIGNTGNIHFHTCAFVWVNRVRSLNSVCEGIKVRSCDRAWITHCYVNRSKLENDGSGKAGIMGSLINHECIIANNIVDDAGGEAIGQHTDCDRVIIANNVCRYRTNGRGYILMEGTNNTTNEQIRDCVITGNTISSRYQCIHIISSKGVLISNNSCTNVGAGDAVGQASAGGDGLRLVGHNQNITITNNYFHDLEHHGMLLTGSCRNLIISDNLIRNVGRAAVDTYDGIRFSQGGSFNYENVKITDNLIDDDRGTPRLRHGFFFDMNGHEIYNAWFTDNQVYNQTGNEFNFNWSTNDRFRNQTRFLNNSGINSGRITNPFNNTHNEVGLAKGSTVTYSYAAAPSASTLYTVVMSPIALTATGGTGVSITVEDPGGNNMVTNATTPLYNVYMQIGWRVNFGAFSAAPLVNVIAMS